LGLCHPLNGSWSIGKPPEVGTNKKASRGSGWQSESLLLAATHVKKKPAKLSQGG
jgi:hypothetical protein